MNKKKEKSGNTILLKDRLNNILTTSDTNFTDKGKDILDKLVKNERMIIYNDLLSKISDPIIKNFDFFKKYGTLYD